MLKKGNRMYFKLAMVCLATIAWAALDTEPQCYSRFDYEYKVVKKLIELENGQKEQRELIEVLLQEIETTRKVSKEKASALEELNGAVLSMNKSIDGLSLEVEGMLKESGLRKGIAVAFSARLSKKLSNIRNNQIIVFDDVILNEGGGYDDTSGVFICPNAGVYLITFTLGIRGEAEFYGTLVINSNTIISATIEGKHGYQDVIGGNTIAARLNKNDRVWVQQTHGTTLETYGDLRTSSFTAVFLFPDA